MGRARIAYAAEESVLLTVDGEMLLAYDAITGDAKWQLRFERALAGVVFAATHTLPRSQDGSPWRSPASGTAAIVVDRDGGIHAVDANVGRVLGSLAAEGAPVAVAASVDGFAVALAERVLVWRDGVRSELPHRATAVAFSRDGSLLALGNARGELRVITLARPDVRAKPVQLDGFVTDISARRLGEWFVATDEDVQHVDGQSTRRLTRGHAHAVLCDPSGTRVALRQSEMCVTVNEWPYHVVARITLDRRIADIAFAGTSLLGIALEGGDVSVVRLSDRTATHTKPQPGRPWREWSCAVDSELEAPRGPSPTASRLGLGALFTLVLVVMGVGYTSSGATRTWMPSPQLVVGDECNVACARGRLATLRELCAARPDSDCAADAEAAQAAYDMDVCSDAQSSLRHIELGLRTRDGGTNPAIAAHVELVERAVAQSCNRFNLPETRRAEIVHLSGRGLVSETDVTPLVGDDPRTLWAAPDGSLFLGTLVRAGRCAIRHKAPEPGAVWRASTEALDCRSVTVFGRAADDVYAGLGTSIRHFNGKKWLDLGFPGEEVRSITGLAAPNGESELLVADAAGHVRRHHAGMWLDERLPASTSVVTLTAGPGAVWAQSVDDTILRRDRAGVWTSLPPARGAHDDGAPLHASMWVAPDGHLFLAYATVVRESADDGATWTEETVPGFVEHVWGRSSKDAYAAGPSGLLRFDGSTWLPTAFSGHVRALAGNATDLYVIADKR